MAGGCRAGQDNAGRTVKQEFGAGIPLLAGQGCHGHLLAGVTSVAMRSGTFKICCCSSAQDFQPLWCGEAKGASLHILSVPSDGNRWGTVSTGRVCSEQRGCLSPAQAVVPNRLSNEPGIGGEREEEKGTLLGAHSFTRW